MCDIGAERRQVQFEPLAPPVPRPCKPDPTPLTPPAPARVPTGAPDVEQAVGVP